MSKLWPGPSSRTGIDSEEEYHHHREGYVANEKLGIYC